MVLPSSSQGLLTKQQYCYWYKAIYWWYSLGFENVLKIWNQKIKTKKERENKINKMYIIII